MIKLKILSLYDKILNSRVFVLLKNNYFLLAFSIVLVAISINNYLCIIILVFYLYYISKKNTSFLYICLIISFIFFISYLIITNKKYTHEDKFIGVVLEAEVKENYQKLLVRTKNTKLIIYSTNREVFNIGDRLEIEDKLSTADKAHLPGGFDYANYLFINKITGSIKTNNIHKTGEAFFVLKIKKWVFNYLDTKFSNDARSYLKALLFGDRSGFDEDFAKSLQDNGLIHLFAVSGLHIGLILAIFTFFFDKFKIKYKNQFLCTFFGLYLVLSSFSPSILRAVMMFYLALINKKTKLMLSSLDVISLVFLSLVIINPLYIYDLGFVLSFLVATMIILVSPLIKDFPNYQQVGLISFFGMLITLPIVISFNNEINLLSFLSNVIFIYLVSSIIMPLALLSFFFYFFQNIFTLIMKSFSFLSQLIAKFIYIPYRAPNFDFLSIVLYYGAIYFIILNFKKPKWRRYCLSLLVLVLLFASQRAKLDNKGEVIFFDLYEGEAILIKEPFNGARILIDTGVGKNNELTRCLMQKGIYSLDILFITHDHFDHYGEAENIIKYIKTKEVITSIYSHLTYATKKVEAQDIVKCKGLEFFVLNPYEYSNDPNDNSLVLYVVINNRSFLFMGDLTAQKEQIIPSYSVDILKIGHHGSITSSGEDFINRIRPQIAIIQVGQQNRFNFPNQQVISRLENVGAKIYTTTDYYTISYTYRYKKEELIYLNSPTF